jgi:ribosome biogenesis GTPase
MQSLKSIGFEEFFQRQLVGSCEVEPAPVVVRVAVEHKSAYEVTDGTRRFTVTLSGQLRHRAQSRLELPAVGDWVLLRGEAITKVLSRKTQLLRQAVGGTSQPQVIAANVDVVFVVTSANLDFNSQRIERYLSAIRGSGAEAAIVLNKSDLAEDPEAFRARLGRTGALVPWFATSALAGVGVQEIHAALKPNLTGVLVGSSGVGKSSLMNALLSEPSERVEQLRTLGDKGRHTSTQRVLRPLAGGGVLLDTPGMRELALYAQLDDEAADDENFVDPVEALAAQCRFRDCTHHSEPGCAVRAQLRADELRDWEKLSRELGWQEQRQNAGLRHRTKRRWKSITKAQRARRRFEDGN